MSSIISDVNFYCACVGPQEGEIYCPCNMVEFKKDMHKKKNPRSAKRHKTRRKKFKRVDKHSDTQYNTT